MSAWAIAKQGIMTLWYPYVRALNTMWPQTNMGGKKIAILPRVYKPLENEYVCADYCHAGDRVLDLGCGSGVGALFCSPLAEQVLAVDISEDAVRNTEENVRLHGLTNVTVRQSDMFTNVEGKFDLILANPPYIAADFARDDQQFATSTRYIPQMFARVDEFLAKDGRLLVQFPIWFRDRIETLAKSNGLRLVSVKRLPPKGPGLFLLSLLYMQVGFRSAHYLIERDAAAASAPDLASSLPSSMAA